MYIPINPWRFTDPEDMPHIEVSDEGAKVLKWILAFLVLALIALFIYAFFFMFR